MGGKVFLLEHFAASGLAIQGGLVSERAEHGVFAIAGKHVEMLSGAIVVTGKAEKFEEEGPASDRWLGRRGGQRRGPEWLPRRGLRETNPPGSWQFACGRA